MSSSSEKTRRKRTTTTKRGGALLGQNHDEKKRRIYGGERKRDDSSCLELWDVIVKWDDICFEHILPRLNGTDVKFLHDVNGETRKLIKRSPFADDLKKRFEAREMSSISTLEVAWEHYPWGTWGDESRMDEPYFCWQVARTNKLELLKWAREEKNCDWDEVTIYMAASQGNLEMLKYCVANKCPINEWACTEAARNGHLEVLKYLREEVKAPWDWRTADEAAQNGHLHILEYLVGRAALEGNLNKVRYCAQYCVANECSIDREACANAALGGHLEVLKYLHEEAKAPWGSATASWAAAKGHLHVLEYLVERKYEYSEWACMHTAKNGHLDCLKYLHETAKAPWNSQAVYYAHEKNQTECLQYLLDNDCPLPNDWSYEGGELRTSE